MIGRNSRSFESSVRDEEREWGESRAMVRACCVESCKARLSSASSLRKDMKEVSRREGERWERVGRGGERKAGASQSAGVEGGKRSRQHW